MIKKHFRTILAVIILTLIVVAPVSAAPLATRRGVDIVDFAFMRGTTYVHVGDTIRWRNEGAVTHTTDSDDELWDADLEPGQWFTYVFNTTGTYNYHCDIHPFMTGSIIVVP